MGTNLRLAVDFLDEEAVCRLEEEGCAADLVEDLVVAEVVDLFAVEDAEACFFVVEDFEADAFAVVDFDEEEDFEVAFLFEVFFFEDEDLLVVDFFFVVDLVDGFEGADSACLTVPCASDGTGTRASGDGDDFCKVTAANDLSARSSAEPDDAPSGLSDAGFATDESLKILLFGLELPSANAFLPLSPICASMVRMTGGR